MSYYCSYEPNQVISIKEFNLNKLLLVLYAEFDLEMIFSDLIKYFHRFQKSVIYDWYSK